MASNELHDPWCKAMLDCTACLREQRAEGADPCLAYLWILEQQLQKEGILVEGSSNAYTDNDDDIYEDDKIPMNYPLRWNQFCATVQEFQDVEVAMQKGLTEKPTRIRYNHSIRLSGQRLLTRLLTFQSEVFAMKATHIARTLSEWTSSAEAYAKAIQTIHKALEVTDIAICKRWNRREMGMELIPSEEELLVEDAEIVVVASKSLVDKRDRLLAQARREETKLVRKLTPQWESRDAAKERLGDRWTNNPSPKYDYARQRADMEADLKQVRKALISLEDLDPNQALQKASGLKEGLLNNQKRVGTPTMVATNESTEELLRAKHRYNHQRPSFEWMTKRVAAEDYPDPVSFGWTFTGSWEAVEFFEKSVAPQNHNNSNNPPKEKLVKLDWYFTTATVKTSLDHPVQGKTQLFAKQCSPQLYAKVLTNPRVHTGKRYQRKPAQGKNNANGKNRRR